MVAAGTVTFKSLFFKDPIVSKIDSEVKGTSDDLACYTRISLGDFQDFVLGNNLISVTYLTLSEYLL